MSKSMVNKHQPIVSDKKARVGWGYQRCQNLQRWWWAVGVKFGLEAVRGGDGRFKEKPNLAAKITKGIKKRFPLPFGLNSKDSDNVKL